ncbi:hypothetical protein [Paeniglutamicibacter sp.]|uniref:hypothetical protein n=1 Tax=Paeniglutamicibacter sp. TaxID=1934391 RepID=UPI00398A40E5
MKALFGTATLVLLVTGVIALTVDPLCGAVAAAAALSSGIGYFVGRHQARVDQQER